MYGVRAASNGGCLRYPVGWSRRKPAATLSLALRRSTELFDEGVGSLIGNAAVRAFSRAYITEHRDFESGRWFARIECDSNIGGGGESGCNAKALRSFSAGEARRKCSKFTVPIMSDMSTNASTALS